MLLNSVLRWTSLPQIQNSTIKIKAKDILMSIYFEHLISKNHMVPSHSSLMLSRTFKLIVTSARTRIGQFSPILGFATSTTVKETMGCAILAHPPKTTPPYSDSLKKNNNKKNRLVSHYLITDSVPKL